MKKKRGVQWDREDGKGSWRVSLLSRLQTRELDGEESASLYIRRFSSPEVDSRL